MEINEESMLVWKIRRQNYSMKRADGLLEYNIKLLHLSVLDNQQKKMDRNTKKTCMLSVSNKHTWFLKTNEFIWYENSHFKRFHVWLSLNVFHANMIFQSTSTSCRKRRKQAQSPAA